MKTLIIRKPKFMRNDISMQLYIDVADIISKEACRPELTPEQRYECLRDVGECLNKAAEAGGFRNAGEMYRWMEVHTTK